jgi:hypothetical protein
MRFDAEPAGMNIGATARQQHTVDHLEQRIDLRDFRRAGKHHGQCAGDVRHRAQTVFSDKVRREIDSR